MGERRGGRVEKTATRGWEDFVKRFPRDGTFILFTLRISGRNHANSVLSPDHAPSHETDFTARRSRRPLPILLSSPPFRPLVNLFFRWRWQRRSDLDCTQADRGITLLRLAHLFHLGDVILLDSRFDLWIGSYCFVFLFFFFFKEHYR